MATKLGKWTIKKLWSYRRPPTITAIYEDEADCRSDADGLDVYPVRVTIEELPMKAKKVKK